MFNSSVVSSSSVQVAVGVSKMCCYVKQADFSSFLNSYSYLYQTACAARLERDAQLVDQ